MQEVFEKIIEKIKEHGRTMMPVIPIDEAIEIVKQASEEFGTDINVGSKGWITCSERLPKYGEVVMCCCENGGITVSCITHKCVKLSKIVWFGQHRVIAWQPLPEPYHPKGE